MADKEWRHKPCGGLVYTEEWAAGIIGICGGCGKRWGVVTPMNDVFDKKGECRYWLFGKDWCEPAEEEMMG